jgi:hypothetical protein
MPIGHKDEDWDKSPDKTSSSKYTIKITDREFEELQSLKDRNYAGLTIAWPPANQVIMKILEQIVKDDELDNYDHDGAAPNSEAPQYDKMKYVRRLKGLTPSIED